jgi:hypothetical protein
VATEEQANKARDMHSDLLVERGAHAIGVESGRSHGKSGFVVVAHVAPDETHDIPSTLTARIAGKTVEVPVVTKQSGRFRPE